ncbi:WD40 repeat-like protein [Paxillus ammoniavirescens]|nr:WD40 repeat-like protein [Paxillus ammoniavirescens]
MLKTSEKSVDLTARPLMTMSGHKEEIRKIAYLPGGERIVTCSFDRTVRIWNVETGEQEGTTMEHEAWVYGLAVTMDGKRVLSGGGDTRIRVWDVETQELVEEWEDEMDGIWWIAVSPDDRWTSTRSVARGDLAEQDVRNGLRGMSVSVDQQASVYEDFLFFFRIFGLGSTAVFETRFRQLQKQVPPPPPLRSNAGAWPSQASPSTSCNVPPAGRPSRSTQIIWDPRPKGRPPTTDPAADKENPRRVNLQLEQQNEHPHRRFYGAVSALQKAGVSNVGLGGNVCLASSMQSNPDSMEAEERVKEVQRRAKTAEKKKAA